MPSAIHSEVIELVLSIDRFEKQVTEASAFMAAQRSFLEKPISLGFKMDVQTEQAASRIRMEIEGIVQAQKKLMDLNAAVTRAQLGSRLPMQGVGSDGRRTGETYLNSDNKMEQLRLKAIQSVVAENRILQSVLRGNLAVQEMQTLQVQKQAALAKSSAGYAVGNTLVSGKTGALFTGAASLSFLTGSNSLGGMFYMMERMSYATGIGQQKLGQFAEKLGLVKLSGEGAEASIAAFGRGVMAAGAVVAAIAAPIGAMFAGNKLNNSLAEMSTLLADATVNGREFDAMINATTASAVKLSGAFNTNAVDVVNGFKLALSTGINADELERFGEVALNMSKGLGASFEQSISILTTFKDAFAGTVEDTVGYSDVLFNAINVGKFNVEQLNANIGRVAVTAAEAGVGFKDMMAALATLNRVGMSTSQAITSLNQMIVSIVNPSDKSKKAFDALGISYGAAALKGRSLLSVINEIKAKVGDNPDLYGQLFSEERARRGAIGLAANPTLFRSNREEMEKTGTAATAAARAMDTFATSMGKIFTTIWSVIQAIGSDLLNVAKDVFFPGGALGTDNIANIANVMETLGIVLKEIGVVVITLTGLVWNLGKVFLSVFTGLIKVGSGDFLGALNDIESATSDLFNGFANGVEAIFTTVGTSAERMLAYTEAAKKGTKETKAALADTTAQASKIVDAFNGMSTVADTSSSNIVNKYEKARAKLQEVKDEAIRAQIAMETKPVAADNAPTKWDELGGVKGSYQLAAYKQAIKEARRLAAAAAEDSIVEPFYAKAQEEVTARYNALMALIEDKKEEWAAKQQADAIKAKQTSAGVNEDITSRHPTSSSPIDVAMVADKLLELNRIQATLINDTIPTAAKMSDDQLSSRVGNLKAQLGALEDASIGIRTLSLDEATQKSALEQIEASRLDIIKEIAKTEATIATEKAERYKSEYDAAVKLYNTKMKFFDKEENRIQRLIDLYDKDIKKASEFIEGEKFRGREGAGRRDTKERIEQGIITTGNISDPKEAANRIKDLWDLIDKMINYGTADGSEDRARRDAKLFAEELKKIDEANKAKLEGQRSTVDEQKRKAGTDMKASVADNPVAQAAMQYADQLVKDALDVASKHGLSVSGDLVSDVQIKNIDINLPISAMKSAINEAVKIEMTKWLNDKTKGNPEPNENANAVGGAL